MFFQHADILACYGRDALSRTIEVCTGSPTIKPPFWRRGPSHVSIIANSPRGGDSVLALWEATTLCDQDDIITGKPKSGVQVHRIMDRLRAYPGEVRRYSLVPSWKLDKREKDLLLDILIHHHTAGYDYRGAGLSGTRIWKLFRGYNPNPMADFCSELCAICLQRIGRMAICNPSRFNPANLISSILGSGLYDQGTWIKRYPFLKDRA